MCRPTCPTHGLKKTGFLKFCEALGEADGFIKSASYLLHSNSFSSMRGFLLDRTVALVQDDSGIPVRYFSSEAWQLRPFGRYLGPIAVFHGQYQKQAQRRLSAGPIRRSSISASGYRWRPHESNLLLAVRPQVAARPRKLWSTDGVGMP